jgi:hypothetical protein
METPTHLGEAAGDHRAIVVGRHSKGERLERLTARAPHAFVAGLQRPQGGTHRHLVRGQLSLHPRTVFQQVGLLSSETESRHR